MNFKTKLDRAIADNNSILVVSLDPNPEMLPARYDESSNHKLLNRLERWLRDIVIATFNQVCAYKLNLGFYQALGSEGFQLLPQILNIIPQYLPIILDAKHADLNSSSVFAETIFQQWGVDAVTLSAYPGQDLVAPFLVYPDKAVFILVHTSNPGATNLQEYPHSNNPFYLQVVKEVKTWASPEQLGLEVGTTNPEILTKIRAIAAERMILLRSIWRENINLKSLLSNGFTENEDGLLIPVPQDLLASDKLDGEIKSLNLTINEAKNNGVKANSSCQIWTSDVCLLNQNPHQDLILQIYDLGCIMFGEYVQASGATFSYYIDLRQIISNPQIFHQVVKAYAEILQKLNFDRIAGIPYGSLPTATGLSMNLNYPMIFPRKEVKAHGTRRLIEGSFKEGEKVVVVDDILISGKSVIEGANKLKSAGLKIEDVVVFIDHEQGVKSKLKQQGYNAYSVLTISEITQTLYDAGKINNQQYQSLRHKP
jgi:uridine monophosphate synthetase